MDHLETLRLKKGEEEEEHGLPLKEVEEEEEGKGLQVWKF